VYKTIVARNVRRSYRLLSEGNPEKGVVAGMADAFEYAFIGDPELPTAGVVHSKDALREVFGRIGALLPGLQLQPQKIVVSGWPWNTTVMSWVQLRGRTAVGEPYANDLLQIMTIRFGKIVALHQLEDTQRLAAACERMAQAGIPDADAAPIREGARR
jgi:ketosteroid isomerase-like protein